MDMNRNANPDDAKVITFRMPRDRADRLRVAAESEHRTVSQEIRRLIDLHLESLGEAA